MQIVLERELKTKSFIVRAEIQKLVKREEIIAILLLAEELGGRVTPQDIVNRLLANRPEKIGQRVIEWCASLNVLTNRGELTQTGIDSLSENKVFISESGIFKFTLTNDPLVPEHVLLIEPSYDGNISQEVFSMRDAGRDYQIEDDLIEIPDDVLNLAQDENNRYNGAGSSSEDIRIVQIDKNGLSGEKPYEDFYTELTINQNNNAKLVITNGQRRKELDPPQISFNFAMNSVLSTNSDKWDLDTNIYKVSYVDLDINEKRSFYKSFSFQNPSIPDFGVFSPISLGFNIQPDTQLDADKWFKWMLMDKITDYLEKSQYEDICNSLVSMFHEYFVTPPSQKELVEEISVKAGKSPKYWFLQAPMDLDIEEVI